MVNPIQNKQALSKLETKDITSIWQTDLIPVSASSTMRWPWDGSCLCWGDLRVTALITSACKTGFLVQERAMLVRSGSECITFYILFYTCSYLFIFCSCWSGKFHDDDGWLDDHGYDDVLHATPVHEEQQPGRKTTRCVTFCGTAEQLVQFGQFIQGWKRAEWPACIYSCTNW